MQEGQFASLNGALDVAAMDAEKAVKSFISDNAEKLNGAQRQADDFEQKLAKARAAIDHLTLRAPISGIVQASAVTTIGQVVASGQEIMRVVPDDGGLKIEVYVLNKDIGFIKSGQPAVVKIGIPFHSRNTARSAHMSPALRATPFPSPTPISSRGTRRARRTARPSPAPSGPRTWSFR